MDSSPRTLALKGKAGEGGGRRGKCFVWLPHTPILLGSLSCLCLALDWSDCVLSCYLCDPGQATRVLWICSSSVRGAAGVTKDEARLTG